MNSKYVKTVSYITLALILASVITAIPATLIKVEAQEAYTILSLTSSRATNTFYNNSCFYVRVDIWTTGMPPEEITLALYSSTTGYMYQVVATRFGTTLSYFVDFCVENGELIYDETSFAPPIKPKVGDYIQIFAGDKILKLEYKPTEPKVTPNVNEIIAPTTLRNLNGWIIEAPDLNADPYNKDYLRNIAVDVYVGTSKIGTIYVYEAVETGVNTGKFKVTDSGSLPDVAVGKTITFKFKIPKDPGEGAYTWTVSVSLPVVSAPPIEIKTIRTEVPLSKYGAVSLQINITDATLGEDYIYFTSGELNIGYFTVAVYDYQGNLAEDVVECDHLEQVETTGTYSGTCSIDTTGLGPAYSRGWIEITYMGSDEETYTKTLPLRLYTASVSVNGTGAINVKYGDKVVIRIEDKERNLDETAKDEFDLMIGETPITFTETGKNTGVFEAVVTIAEDGDLFALPGGSIAVEYEDPTSPSTTPDMENFLTDSYSATISVLKFKGELTTSKTAYGPYENIVIYITDPDMNRKVNSKDYIPATQIFIKKADGTFANIGPAEETGKNTGVFKITVAPSALGAIKDVLLMRETMIVYRDTVSPEGISVLSTTVSIISWDAVLVTDKDAYNLGEKIKINVTDPDANTDPNTIDVLTNKLKVASTTDPAGVYVTLVETGPNTGVFTAEILVTDKAVGTGFILARLGDEITITYTDTYPANYAGKSATFTKVVRVGVPVEKPIVPSEARFVDPFTGQPVTPTVGKTIGIGVTLSNTGPVKTSFTVLLIVRDATGAAVSIQWLTVTLSPGEVGEAGFTFTPTVAGAYTIEVYVIKSLADWTPMGTTLTAPLTVS